MPNTQPTRQSRTAAPPRPDVDPAARGESVAVPEDLDEAALALAQAPATGAGAVAAAIAAAQPSLDPPGTPGAARAVIDAGIFSNVRVLSLFSSGHSMNGYGFLEGVGWRRFATTNPSAHVNLGLLASGAREQGFATPVRHEADGQIHEIYLW
jgi:hypothetical protein